MPWSDRAFRLLPALLLLLVAACGPDLQPYRGRPGGAAWLLAQPPAYRIAIPPAQAVLLSDKAAGELASILAEALRDAEVPAVAAVPLPLDWPLSITVDRQGNQVLPRYELRDADGTQLGIASGKAIPLNDWGTESAPLLKEVVTRDAPAIAALLTNVQAARKASDPAALAGRGPLRIRLAGVKGAPGDGNASLKNSIENSLSKLGLVPQDVAEGASYAVQGEVNMVAMAGNQQRVEIQWIVTRRDGEELGRVLQMNVVPKNTLNGLWGDVAFVVAEEAAGGIRQVLRNATNTNPDHPAPEAATPASATPGAGAAAATPAAAPVAAPAAKP